MPKISVLLPTYNAEAFLSETLASILSQSETDFELIVLDDHSLDATVEIVRAVQDPRIRLHVNAVNLGLPTNINIGLALARGDYIARMDHDDLAMPDRLSRQSSFLDENPDVTILGGQIDHFDQYTGVSEFPITDSSIKARLLSGRAYLANPATMFRLKFVKDHRIFFDPNLYAVDDLGFFVDCMMGGAKFANLPEVVLRYRIHRAMTSFNLDIDHYFQSKARVYRRLLPAYFPGITGAECERLLDLYRYKDLAPTDLQSLSDLFHSAGRALSNVSESLGQDRVQVADTLAQMLMDHVNVMIREFRTISFTDFKEVLEPIYLKALNHVSPTF